MEFLNYITDNMSTMELVEASIGIWLIFGGWKKVIRLFKRGK